MRNLVLVRSGYAGAFVGLLASPYVLMAMAAPGPAPPPADIRTVLPLDPDVQLFFDTQVACHEALFGAFDLEGSLRLSLFEPITTEGEYLGYNEQGDTFGLVVEDLLPVNTDGAEQIPGFLVSDTKVVHGRANGVEQRLVVGLTATVVAGGGAAAGGVPEHIFVPFGIQPLPDGDFWAGDDFTTPFLDDQGQCLCPVEGEPCFYVCPLCPDGNGVFCPWCDRDVCETLICPVESAYYQCVQAARDRLQSCLDLWEWHVWFEVIHCLFFWDGIHIPLCLFGLGLAAAHYLHCLHVYHDDLEQCLANRRLGWELAYNGYCMQP